MQIKPLTCSDIEQMLFILSQYDFPSWDRKVLLDSFDKDNYIVGINSSDHLLGFIICQLLYDECHIMLIMVLATEQKNGRGSLLLRESLAYGRSQGCRSVELEVSCLNQHAIDFYLSHGFKVVGRRRNYCMTSLGHCDALVMSLKLMY